MKVRYLLALAVVVLLAAACGPQMATPTPPAGSEQSGEVTTAVAEEDTPAVGEAATPAAVQVTQPAAAEPITDTGAITSTGSITSTGVITPAGGVEVALAAIKPLEGVLATVNGQEITWAEYEPELRRALYSVTQQYGVDWNQPDNIALLAEFQDQIIQGVADRTLMRQLAAAEGIEVTPSDLQAGLEEQKTLILESGQFSSWEQFKEQAGVDDEYFARLVEDSLVINKLMEAHAPAREAEQVHARHILVADEETGKQVLDRLNAGEDWAALAKEYSQDTSNKDNSGDLGWFPRGAMVPEFEEAAFTLEPGTTSDLVKTDFGYHILQVLEKGTRELDEQTYSGMMQQAFQKWLDEQKAAAEMTIIVNFGPEQ